MTDGIEGHTVKRFDGELMELHRRVLEMGGLAGQQIHDAICALRLQDLKAARQVLAREQQVDALELSTDDLVIKILTRRQPVAGDLRLVMAVSKSVTDLERIGDLAERIARYVVHIYNHDRTPPNEDLLLDLWDMEAISSALLRESLEAFDRLSASDAQSVLAQGGELENKFRSSLRRLVTFVMDDARNVGHMVQIVLIAKSLERVADHARNIAQYVVYCDQGEDVRHMGSRVQPQGSG